MSLTRAAEQSAVAVKKVPMAVSVHKECSLMGFCVVVIHHVLLAFVFVPVSP